MAREVKDLVSVALVPSLAQELPHAAGTAKKTKKQTNKTNKQTNKQNQKKGKNPDHFI